jgi:hypothetical protein
MAAARRRTTFAAPFVITVAAGCSPSTDRAAQPTHEPPRTWVVHMRGMTCEATENVRGGPPLPQPVECPPGMTSTVVMQIEQEPGKSYCTSRGAVTGCPLPYGERVKQPLQVMWLIEKEGVDCHAEDFSRCPKGADCNPPKPVHFPCPPGVTEDHPLVLAELPDATCVRVPDGCGDTSCARDQVPCLPSAAKPVPRD